MELDNQSEEWRQLLREGFLICRHCGGDGCQHCHGGWVNPMWKDKSTADRPHATSVVSHEKKEVKPGKQLKVDCTYCGLHFETRAKRRRHEKTCERRTDANH